MRRQEKEMLSVVTRDGTQISHKDSIPSSSNPLPQQKRTYSHKEIRENEDPCYPVHWPRGDAGTNLALRLGIITEDQVED